MEERIIIEGKPSKKISSRLLIIGCIILAVGLICIPIAKNIDPHYDEVITFWATNRPGFLFEGLLTLYEISPYVAFFLDCGLLIGIIGLIRWLCIKDNAITVTNKRVYGVTKWKKRIDLPINQISAVSTSFLKGIAVGTSSGKIIFKAIENNLDVHKEITSLLAEKQEASKSSKNEIELQSSNLDEIKKLKELLDSGIITQEEFDAKKKQLLGI